MVILILCFSFSYCLKLHVFLVMIIGIFKVAFAYCTFKPFILGVTTDDNKEKPATGKLYDFTKYGTDVVDQLIGLVIYKIQNQTLSNNFPLNVKNKILCFPGLVLL